MNSRSVGADTHDSSQSITISHLKIKETDISPVNNAERHILKTGERPYSLKILSVLKMLNCCSLQEFQEYKAAVLKLLTKCFLPVGCLSGRRKPTTT